MKKTIYFIFAGFLSIIACQNRTNTKSKNFNKEIKFKNDLKVEIIDSTGKKIASFKTELADDEYKRQTGLMYRKIMNDDQAMLFVFDDEEPRYFYMKNTYIPLDIIYIDANKRIVSWIKNAKPLDETTLPSTQPAQFVLEIKSGLIEQKGIKKGMKTRFNLPKKD